MSKIRSRITERGHVHESAWPPEPEVGTSKGFSGYWDKNLNKFVEGFPQPIEKFDIAPSVRTDDISEPYYHEKAQKWLTSRSAIKQADADTNSLTLEKRIHFDRASIEAENRKKASEIRKASYQKAIYALRDNNTPLANPEIRAKREAEREATLKEAGLSLDNVDLTKVTRHGGTQK